MPKSGVKFEKIENSGYGSPNSDFVNVNIEQE